MAAVFGVARIIDLVEGVFEATQGVAGKGAAGSVATESSVAVLEALGGSGPTEDGHQLVAALFRVLLVNALPEHVRQDDRL